MASPALAKTPARETTTRGRWTPYLLLAPSVVLVAGLLVVPLLIVAVSSLQPNVLLKFEGPAFDNYTYLADKAFYLKVLWRTIWLAGLSTLIAVPVGYGAALVISGLPAKHQNLALMALTFPILAGPLAVVLGWMALLTDGGPIFGPLIAMGLIGPQRLLGSPAAVVIGMVQFVLPFAVLTIYTAITRIPAALSEAAASLGAARWTRFKEVILPMSAPGLVSAAVIAFSLSASSYVAPYYLGGPGQQTLTTLVSQFILATYNSQLAAATAVVLLAVMVLSTWGITRILGRIAR